MDSDSVSDTRLLGSFLAVIGTIFYIYHMAAGGASRTKGLHCGLQSVGESVSNGGRDVVRTGARGCQTLCSLFHSQLTVLCITQDV